MASPRHKQRTYGRFRDYSRRGNEKHLETDRMYFLKLVLVFLLGTFWLKFHAPIEWNGVTFAGFPLGFVLGLFLVSKYEHFQSDRKIWYAILLIVTIVSYFLPAGIML